MGLYWEPTLETKFFVVLKLRTTLLDHFIGLFTYCFTGASTLNVGAGYRPDLPVIILFNVYIVMKGLDFTIWTCKFMLFSKKSCTLMFLKKILMKIIYKITSLPCIQSTSPPSVEKRGMCSQMDFLTSASRQFIIYSLFFWLVWGANHWNACICELLRD